MAHGVKIECHKGITMKTAYVSNGNLPSRFAHAMQIMKNAQAWHRCSGEFVFVCNFTLGNWLTADEARIHRFYGISTPFSMKRYPLFGPTGTPWPMLDDWYYQKAARYLKEWGAELVFTRTFGMPQHAVAQGLPTLIETHGLPGGSKAKTAMYEQLDNDHFLGIVTISDVLRDKYIAYGLPAEKIFTAADGVDLSLFANPLSPDEARRSLGYDPEGPYVLYVGHLYDDRGIGDILAIAPQFPAVRFLFVGGHVPDVRRWQATAAHRALDNVEFTGFVDNAQVATYLWMADVLLMPYSRSCPTAQWMSPLKLFEYMAAGRAILASDLEAIRAVLTHNEQAWLVAPDDPAALAEGLGVLLEDEALRESLGYQAMAQVQPYSWEARVRRIMAFARDRLGG